MVKIVWTQTALKQLERIVKFIEQEQGPSVARTVGEHIIDRSEHLEKFPEMGVVEGVCLIYHY